MHSSLHIAPAYHQRDVFIVAAPGALRQRHRRCCNLASRWIGWTRLAALHSYCVCTRCARTIEGRLAKNVAMHDKFAPCNAMLLSGCFQVQYIRRASDDEAKLLIRGRSRHLKLHLRTIDRCDRRKSQNHRGAPGLVKTTGQTLMQAIEYLHSGTIARLSRQSSAWNKARRTCTNATGSSAHSPGPCAYSPASW